MLRRLYLWLFLLLVTGGATAHEMSMAEMTLREVRPGEFLMQWTASGSRPADDELTPRWPAGCVTEENMLHCGGGLRGVITIDGVGERYSAALIKVFWRDGQSRVYTLTKRQPTVHLYGSAEDQRGMGEIARAYVVLGVEHILGGIDHLLFVAALLFLVGFQRKLVWTITAFTLAHSLTLALAALGWLTLRSPPVEATIALSIVLVAAEALNRRETIARRLPAVVAFLFGLIHGLGFAGALSEIGLPRNHLATALVTFNIGVELGQLMAVAVAWAGWRLVRHTAIAQRARVPLLYGMGSVAAWWSWARIAAMFAS
jgi:hydrogenase/urease accessory protein HupE